VYVLESRDFCAVGLELIVHLILITISFTGGNESSRDSLMAIQLCVGTQTSAISCNSGRRNVNMFLTLTDEAILAIYGNI
jgi:hypothetical protein